VTGCCPPGSACAAAELDWARLRSLAVRVLLFLPTRWAGVHLDSGVQGLFNSNFGEINLILDTRSGSAEWTGNAMLPGCDLSVNVWLGYPTSDDLLGAQKSIAHDLYEASRSPAPAR